jgi:hypothetical protein
LLPGTPQRPPTHDRDFTSGQIRKSLKVVLSSLLALALHVAVGWAWTALAGVVSGWWALKRGWLAGASAVGLAWGALVCWNYAVAPQEVSTMWRTLGQFAAGAPAWLVPILTVLAGVLIGAAGGWFGAEVARLWDPRKKSTANSGEATG